MNEEHDHYPEDDEKTASRRKKPPRQPKKMTEARLANIALHYLERYASSEENLRRVLLRRVEKSARAHTDVDRDEAKGWIEALIKRYVEVGLLDDLAYASARTRSALERGEAPRMAEMKLKQKGISDDIARRALQELAGDFPAPELEAAIRHARKKRIGPYRIDAGARAGAREKDLGAMARAGFSYDWALAVIDAENTHELEERLEQAKNR